MLLITVPAGDRTLPREELDLDKRECRKFGPCGAGERALYIGSRFLSRSRYVPWREVRRVFKRVAMSAGGFSGKGLFGSMPYLVVQLSGGRELQCLFKRENEVDDLLAFVEREHPEIPVHSAQAEKRLAEAEAKERARYKDKLTPEAEKTLGVLRGAKEHLEDRPSLSNALTAAAKQKRIADNLPLWLPVLGTVLAAAAIVSAAWGLTRVLAQDSSGWYYLLGGAAVFFFTLSTNMLPSKWTSKKYAQKEWEAAVAACGEHIAVREYFPVPAQYAHITVLERMIRVVREGRAQTPEEALETVKSDLRALNSSVTVSQKEHDEVVEIKPMFIICDYGDELK